MSLIKLFKNFDFVLIGAIIILSIFSIAMIDSTIAGNFDLLDQNITLKQTIFLIMSLGLVIAVTLLDYHMWVMIARLLYVFLFFFLGYVFIAGDSSFGSQRWIDLGFISIQPSELAKITIVVVLADFFSRTKNKVNDFRYIGISLIVVAGLMAFIFLQPDLSTSLVLLVIWFALLWSTGLSWKNLGIFFVGGISLAAIAYPFLQDYQKARVTAFLFPDPNASYGAEYNINQAIITLGNGGFFGRGYGQGSQIQLRFMKVRHTDFIFSAIGEEFGFVGNVFVIVMLAIILWRIMRVAARSHDMFGALICVGVATIIFFHTLINIGMNLQLMPVTGLPLPFVSYGGSSLLSMMLGIALVESVAVRTNPIEST